MQCFFVDNSIHTTSEEDIIDDGAEDQLEFLNEEVERIGEFVQSQEAFICRDIQECMTLND
jgi:hypothetical protein